MDNTSTLILGASCGVLCIAGSYFLLNMGAASSVSTPSQKERKTVENDDKLFPAGKMFVYFGSQTGTAEGFAKVIEKEGIARGFNAKRVDLEDFDPTQMAESRLAVFLMATYGEGEHTDNATAFHLWMKNENGESRDGVLKDISFTVFGLGNRQYEQFNQMGKRTNAAMEICGAKRVFEYGEGDDDGSLEDDFEKWRTTMWPALMSQFHPDAATAAVDDNEEKKIVSTYELITSRNSSRPSTANVVSSKPFFIAKQATIGVNRELRNVTDDNSKEVGSTRHIEIELPGTGLTYSTADNLAVLPENDSVSVLALAESQGYPLDESYYMDHTDGDKGKNKDDFPSPFTARDVLTRFLDIKGIPSVFTLTQLIPYVTDPAQKQGLRNLLSKDKRSKLHKMIEAGGRSVCDLLSSGGELSSCKISLRDFMHIIPHIQPRYYTISSSSSCFPDSIHITVSVTEFGSVSRRKGLCSGYLQGLEAGKSTCRVFVRPSTFKLPKEVSTPIIMIGPGTGVAPMRGLLQERKFHGLQGKNTLFFGCKNRDIDYIYKSEMDQHVEGKALTNLHLAFSREQKEKLYVQHLIGSTEQAKELVTDLDAGGHIYVCGATAMGADVMEKIIEVISTHKSMTKTIASEYVKSLQTSGRYVQELWSTG